MTKEEQVIETIRKGPGMSPNVYQRLAIKICNIPYEKKRDMLMHAVLGLASEAGELAGIFQKKYQGHKIDPGECRFEAKEPPLGWPDQPASSRGGSVFFLSSGWRV